MRDRWIKAGHVWLAGVLVAALACQGPPAPPAESPLTAPPVDARLNVTTAQALGWNVRREIAADLDADGSPETLLLTADVEVDARGRALWEDGHRWALVIRDQGASTLAYAAFVPNGFVEAALLQASSEGRREVLLQERTPQQLHAVVVAYDAPGKARTVSAAYYQVETWFPGSASLRD